MAKTGYNGCFFICGERAVVEAGRHPVADERIHLVLHQRDQGRHDDGEALANDGRCLKAQ